MGFLRKTIGKNNLHRKLLFLFVLLTLLPASAISIGSIIVGYINGRQQSVERLSSVTALKATEIDAWVKDRQQDLIFILNEAYGLDRIQTIYKLARRDQYYDYYYEALRKSLMRYIQKTPDLLDIALIDLNGVVVLSTNDEQLGRSYNNTSFITSSYDEIFTLLWWDPLLHRFFLVSGTPVYGADNEKLGIMISRSSVNPLIQILTENTGLGKTGKAYLVNPDYELIGVAHLASESTEQDLFVSQSQDFDKVLGQSTPIEPIYRDQAGARVIGQHRWLSYLDLALFVEQDFSEAFTAIFTSLTVNLIIAAVTLVLAVTLSLVVTGSIARPISELADSAASIASGDFDHRVTVEREDEIGLLASAFNHMTDQLSALVGKLEDRVKERTLALQQRALQLETSSRVSREITSILNIDDLLVRIVDLIRESFGYYNVHIYLYDATSQRLVLRAVSGQAQPTTTWLELNARSLNSKAMLTNQAILVNDVSQSRDFQPDEGLPDTRSELVIPLRMGERVIGTLDVHSRNVGAFRTEDMHVIQSLGDQVAIAIENARLYEQSQRLAVMEERNRLARDLHDSVTQSLYSLGLLIEGWRETLFKDKQIPVEELLNRIGEINQQALREMRLLIHELRPPVLQEEGLLNALQKRLDAVENRAGISARVIADEFISLPVTVEENLYRISQEALNNVLKHSQATHVTIQIHTQDESVCLQVIDDGCGFDPKTAILGGGLGLSSMQERARSIGAVLEILSSPGKGSTLQVTLPKMS